MSAFIDLVGERFGRLVVAQYVKIDNKTCSYFLCKCDCGGKKIVRAANLKNGTTTSCGCFHKELITKHGQSRINSSLYHRWQGMHQRCENKNRRGYHNYGGRGITVCEEWHEFTNFQKWSMSNGYSPNLEIDRIDNNGNYEPLNCRWATRIDQSSNRRTNHIITFNGDTKTLSQWADCFRIKRTTLDSRINKKHMPIEKALYFRRGL